MAQDSASQRSIRQRLRGARSYVCYYGAGGLESISTVDAAILAAEAYSPAELERLSRSGTVTLGYISLGQDASEEASAWVRRSNDGQPLRDEQWGSQIVNPAQSGWQLRIKSASDTLLQNGFQGLFFDTLDSERPEDQAALVALILILRDRHPDVPMVINRGFALLPQLGQRIDGVMFESLSCTWQLEADGRVTCRITDEETTYFNRQYAQDISRYAESLGLLRLALDYTDSPTLEAHAQSVARELGFVSWCSDRLLMRLPMA
jgi:polysaccharide biosynthesis protein PelA